MPSDGLELILNIGHKLRISKDLIVPFLSILQDLDDLQVFAVHIFD